MTKDLFRDLRVEARYIELDEMGVSPQMKETGPKQ
jgi:hypothetical protein